MELLKALTVDAAPSFVGLFRFALVSALEALRSLFLLYPLNVLIIFVACFAMFYKLTTKVLPKPKYKAEYTPLKHCENSSEEVKILKK